MGTPLIPSTMSFADLYGHRTPGQENPNDAADTEKASGQTGGVLTKRPAYIWLFLFGGLLLARVVLEKKAR